MSEQPRLVLRAEHDEWGLIAKHPGLLDAVLLCESHVAPYPAGHLFEHTNHRRLADTVTAIGLPRWRDPQTAGLVSRSVLRLGRLRRMLQTPLAKQLPMPLVLELLADPAARRHALGLVLSSQAGDESVCAPYFDVARRDSVAHRLNLAFASETARAAGSQVPTVIVQVTLNRLLGGLAAQLAGDYAATGARRVLLRVRGLKSEQADRGELSAYIDAIAAYSFHGLDCYGDCAGILGPVLIAGGAAGFTTGSRFFKSVPGTLLATGGGGGGQPIAEVPAGSWEPQAAPSGQQPAETRVKNLEALREKTRIAVEEPAALIDSLRHGSAHTAVWAAVLAERERRAS